MIAKDRETARLLSHEFACGYVRKQYLALGFDVSFSKHRHPHQGLIFSDMMRVRLQEMYDVDSGLHGIFISCEEPVDPPLADSTLSYSC